MSANVMSEDSRSRKTEKALYDAMYSLLRKISFRKITIKSICEEAFISRAAFYAHYIDKYDLLQHWIPGLWPEGLSKCKSYEETEKLINHHAREHMLILRNLVNDADDETFGILRSFLLSAINLSVDRSTAGSAYPKNVIMANFYASGLISYLLWQIQHNFPPDVPPMNPHLYDMVHTLRNWHANTERSGGNLP